MATTGNTKTKNLSNYLHLYLGCDINTGGQIERLKSVDENGNIETLFRGHLINYYNINDYECKLILRPLSDMTKEIEHNGNKFIPLKVLAGMAGTCSPGDWIIKSEYEVEHKTAKGCTFRISSSFDFIMKRSEKWKDFEVCAQQVLMFKKSIEWGFDLFGLIESGLAIDKNTLK